MCGQEASAVSVTGVRRVLRPLVTLDFGQYHEDGLLSVLSVCWWNKHFAISLGGGG